MTSRIVLGVVILGLGAPAARAQQTVSVQVPETALNQVRAFEHSLRGAIDRAAGEFQKTVKNYVPDGTKLTYQVDPIVTSILEPEGSAVFHVFVPAILEPADRMILGVLMRQAAQAAAASGPGAARVSSGTVGAPVGNPDATVNAVPNLDLEYGTQVRRMLIDTILDNALTLPVPDGQNLTVYADELLVQPASPFTPRARTLMLRIKGADLIALRQDRITRDEAKARILEYKYPN